MSSYGGRHSCPHRERTSTHPASRIHVHTHTHSERNRAELKMSEYSSRKVAELKDLLKARGLSVTGTKPELIARLEESDKEEGSGQQDEENAGDGEQDVVVEKTTENIADAGTTNNDEDEIKETSAPSKAADTTATSNDNSGETSKEGEKEDEAQHLTNMVIAELEKRLKRSQRFGIADDDTEQRLARIKKLGIEPAQAKKILTGTMTKNQSGSKYGGVSKPSVEEAEKLKKRRERFSGASSAA